MRDRSAEAFALHRLALHAVMCAALVVAASAPARGQTFSQRGFAEGDLFAFAQRALDDPTRVVGDGLVREEAFYKPIDWLQFAGGLELRANSHDQVDDRWTLDFGDRGIRRPRLSVRRLSATVTRGRVTIDIGKQFIRWGQTDVVTPTDRFAPRDFLTVIDAQFLPVTGVRGVVQHGDETFEGVWVPRLTPSRIPLFDQRWTAVPPGQTPVALVDDGSDIPGGSQSGIRWSHVGAGFETSLSFFDGFNHLPNIDARVAPPPLNPLAGTPLTVVLTRVYPSLREYGADAALPTRWFTVKAEAAYFTSSQSDTDEYVLYVVQLERQSGEWLFVAGYAGEAVTRQRAPLTFAPDRGLTRSIVGRASYTIDPRRSVALEGAARQNGNGVYLRGEYSETYGNHWRVTLAGAAMAGHSDDFLGQYRRNTHAVLTLRYSF